jgi:hypothetical protein
VQVPCHLVEVPPGIYPLHISFGVWNFNILFFQPAENNETYRKSGEFPGKGAGYPEGTTLSSTMVQKKMR